MASALACSGGAFKAGDELACGESPCTVDQPPVANRAGSAGSASGGGAALASHTAGSAHAGTGAAAGSGGRPSAGTGGGSATGSSGSPEFARAGQGGESDDGAGQPGFPATEVLDDFNRLGAGIGASWLGDADEYALNKQTLWCEFCGGAALWSTEFGVEQEVFATYAGFDPDAMEINLVLKAQKLPNCELIEVLYSPDEGTARVAYCVEDDWTDSEKVLLLLRAGDQFGGRAHADGTIELFVNGAVVASFDASGFPHQTGHIGVNGLSGPSGNSWDDFGGGNWQK